MENGSPENIAIIGAGTQGSQIAFRCAIYGMNVNVYDISDAALTELQGKVSSWAEMFISTSRLNKKSAQLALNRINVNRSLKECVNDADIIIESVPEVLELKQQVWGEVDKSAPLSSLLGTNSSSLRSSEIAGSTNRKDKTFNINFAFPVEDLIVEVMWNKDTSIETQKKVKCFLKMLEMVMIETRREIKGFSFNRVWRAIKKECLYLYDQNYCDFEDLDRAFILAFGTKYGPFAIMDQIGLDIIRDIEFSYFAESGDHSDKPPESLIKMIEKGNLGVKSGKGFYTYPNPAYERKDWLFKKIP